MCVPRQLFSFSFARLNACGVMPCDSKGLKTHFDFDGYCSQETPAFKSSTKDVVRSFCDVVLANDDDPRGPATAFAGPPSPNNTLLLETVERLDKDDRGPREIAISAFPVSLPVGRTRCQRGRIVQARHQPPSEFPVAPLQEPRSGETNSFTSPCSCFSDSLYRPPFALAASRDTAPSDKITRLTTKRRTSVAGIVMNPHAQH
jgi:hypothetical protein